MTRDPSEPIYLSALDPCRPALDLLEGILSGIRATFLIWAEESDEADLPDEDASAEAWDEYHRGQRESFASVVLSMAASRRHRIGLGL